MKAGGIAPLVALVRDGTEGQKWAGARALWSLACENAANQVAIAKAGGIAPLVALVRDGTDGQKRPAAAALANLANRNSAAIAQAGGIAPLVALAGGDRCGDAVEALGNLAATSASNREAIVKAGGIAPLVELVRNGSDTTASHSVHGVAISGQQELAAVALAFLAENSVPTKWRLQRRAESRR